MAGSQAAKWEETQVKRCLNSLYPFAGIMGLYFHRGVAGQGFLRLWIRSAQENSEATGETLVFNEQVPSASPAQLLGVPKPGYTSKSTETFKC